MKSDRHLDSLKRRQSVYAAHKRWRIRNQLAQLTADGKPRTRMNLNVPTPFEQAWSKFRNQNERPA